MITSDPLVVPLVLVRLILPPITFMAVEPLAVAVMVNVDPLASLAFNVPQKLMPLPPSEMPLRLSLIHI